MKRLMSAVCLILLTATSTRAASVQFSQAIDLAPCVGPATFCSVFSPMSPQVLAVGDIVDYLVTFAPGQRLVVTDLTGTDAFLQPFLGAPSVFGNFTIVDASATLRGMNGALAAPLAVTTMTSGSAHIGPSFTGFIGAGESVSFTGYQVHFTVAGLPSAFNAYSANLLLVGGTSVRVVADAAAVPESSTLMLCGLGLAGMALYMRRRARLGPSKPGRWGQTPV